MTTPGLRTLCARPLPRLASWLSCRPPSRRCSTAAVSATRSGRSPRVTSVWPAGARTWRACVGHRFDLGIAIPESVSSALLMRLGGVRHTVGFARDGIRRRLLDRVIEAPVGWGRRRLVSRERYVLGLLAAIGVEGGETDLVLAVSPGEEERLAWALADAGADPAGLRRTPPVVIAPGASYGDSKCWPAESYAALADRLAARDLPIVLVGAPSEAARVQSVARAMEHPAIVLAGTLDVGALKALLRVARALVANDAGARHVAAAFGTPSLLFFGPTSVRQDGRQSGAGPDPRGRARLSPVLPAKVPDRPSLPAFDLRGARRAGLRTAGFGRGVSLDRSSASDVESRAPWPGTVTIDLSVVVVSYETADLLAACLDSVVVALAAHPELRAEVILVDNGSRDDSLARVAGVEAPIRLVAFARNRGFATAVNAALRLRRGRHVCCS